MVSTCAAAEAAILDDPDDDAAWHAYVPWLRAAGDLRAEMIELAAEADTPERRATLDAWTAEGIAMHTPSGVAARACEWRHGFPIAATLHIADRGDVRRVVELMADPRARLLGRLQLHIGDGVPARSLAGLDGAGFEWLRALRAAYQPRGNRLVRALVSRPSLQLRSLDLRHSGLTDDGLLALAAYGGLGSLRSLYLQHNRFTAIGVSALARSSALSGLTLLDLRHNAVGAAGAAALAGAPLGGLARLQMFAADVEPAGVHALATSTTLPRDLVRYWRAQEVAP